VSNLDGLLPKSLFTLSKTFLIPAVGGIPGALKTRPPGPAASGIQSAYLPLRDLGNSPFILDGFNLLSFFSFFDLIFSSFFYRQIIRGYLGEGDGHTFMRFYCLDQIQHVY
jgi:hypothetical protein